MKALYFYVAAFGVLINFASPSIGICSDEEAERTEVKIHVLDENLKYNTVLDKKIFVERETLASDCLDMDEVLESDNYTGEITDKVCKHAENIYSILEYNSDGFVHHSDYRSRILQNPNGYSEIVFLPKGKETLTSSTSLPAPVVAMVGKKRLEVNMKPFAKASYKSRANLKVRYRVVAKNILTGKVVGKYSYQPRVTFARLDQASYQFKYRAAIVNRKGTELASTKWSPVKKFYAGYPLDIISPYSHLTPKVNFIQKKSGMTDDELTVQLDPKAHNIVIEEGRYKNCTCGAVCHSGGYDACTYLHFYLYTPQSDNALINKEIINSDSSGRYNFVYEYSLEKGGKTEYISKEIKGNDSGHFGKSKRMESVTYFTIDNALYTLQYRIKFLTKNGTVQTTTAWSDPIFLNQFLRGKQQVTLPMDPIVNYLPNNDVNGNNITVVATGIVGVPSMYISNDTFSIINRETGVENLISKRCCQNGRYCDDGTEVNCKADPGYRVKLALEPGNYSVSYTLPNYISSPSVDFRVD